MIKTNLSLGNKRRKLCTLALISLLISHAGITQAGETRRISLGQTHGGGDLRSENARVSADGRYVVFETFATDIVEDATLIDFFEPSIALKDLHSGAIRFIARGRNPSISGDGRIVAFNTTNNPPGIDVSLLGRDQVIAYDQQTDLFELVSVNANGEVSLHRGAIAETISEDGRFVAFKSGADNLAPGNDGFIEQIFVRDRQLQTTEIASRLPSGEVASQNSRVARLNADGRYVVFRSGGHVYLNDRATGETERVDTPVTLGHFNRSLTDLGGISRDGRYVAFTTASGLVAEDTNELNDVYIRDRSDDSLRVISLNSDGSLPNTASAGFGGLAISSNGRFVSFVSEVNQVASNILDVFVFDLQTNTLELVSSSVNAGENANQVSVNPSISQDGSVITFQSDASNLVFEENNGATDVFGRFRATQTTQLVSRRLASITFPAAANGPSALLPTASAKFSDDGRFVIYASRASNLAQIDNSSREDIFLHDLNTSTTTRLSQNAEGIVGNEASLAPTISGDGSMVAFMSRSDNLTPNDTNRRSDIFLVDRPGGDIRIASTGLGGVASDGHSFEPAFSSNNRYIAFHSTARNLVSGDTNGKTDIFLLDLNSDAISLLSRNEVGDIGNNNSFRAVVSADARFVAFVSTATNLVSGVPDGVSQVYLLDRDNGSIELISRDASNTPGNASSDFPAIDATGRYVAYQTLATNLTAIDTNGTPDVFVFDRQIGVTTLISGTPAGDVGNGYSTAPTLSADGRLVSFQTTADNLVNIHGAFGGVVIHDRTSGEKWLASVSTSGTPAERFTFNGALSPSGQQLLFASPDASLDDTVESFGLRPLASNHQLYVRWLDIPTTSIEVTLEFAKTKLRCGTKRKSGEVPLTVFGSVDFDASALNLDGLTLNTQTVREKHNKVHLKDVNQDGLLDAELHLLRSEMCEVLSSASGETTLTIEATFGNEGTPMKGTDTLIVQ